MFVLSVTTAALAGLGGGPPHPRNQPQCGVPRPLVWLLHLQKHVVQNICNTCGGGGTNCTPAAQRPHVQNIYRTLNLSSVRHHVAELLHQYNTKIPSSIALKTHIKYGI